MFAIFKNLDIFHTIDNSGSVFKNQLRCIAHNFFCKHEPDKKSSPLFSRQDLEIFKVLSGDYKLRITLPDKGNGVVILDRDDYVSKIMNCISGSTKFQKSRLQCRKITIQLD